MGQRLAWIHRAIVEVLEAFPALGWRWSRCTAT